MTEKPLDLDKHRGMAAQKATDIRRALAEVENNARDLRDRQAILEDQLLTVSAASWPEAFVPDLQGSGTTLYAARTQAGFRPAFGPDSRFRHVAQGAAELLLPGIMGLRRDVDTAEDLRAAARLGLGSRTSAVAMELLRAAG